MQQNPPQKPVYKKPTVRLSGTSGNALAIISKVRQSLRKNDAPEEIQQQFLSEATSGDYNHLLQTCMKFVNVR